ncbi:hypothetical protein F5Y19DRAFT_154085 [Xylariaceae sp. FL1651]|nr:hypothetical protein F5Y19DRAFT_154085 [Xylariaceae sp. FL1651]
MTKVGQYTFVSIDGDSGRVKEGDRELVRSRCMKGKNKREDSRRSLRAVRQSTSLSKEKKPLPHRKAAAATTPSRSAPDSKNLDRSDEDPESSTMGRDGDLRITSMRSRQRHSSLSLHREITQFMSEDTPTYPRELASMSSIFQRLKSMIYPIYPHIHFEDKIAAGPLQWLVHDDLFRHATLFIISVHKARMQQKPLDAGILRQHQVTLALLNTRLSDETQHPLTDTTVWSITLLAYAALWLARHAELAVHLRALKQLYCLYGGKSFMRQHPTLGYYTYGLELASSISSGNYPAPSPFDSRDRIFAPQAVYFETHRPLMSSLANALLSSMSGIIDSRVIYILRSLQDITLRIDNHRTQNKHLDSFTFQAFYKTIWSRLLSLRYLLEDVTSECLRLGLLAYLNITVLRVPAAKPGHRDNASLYPYLTDSFRNTCRAIELSAPQLGTLVFWLLTIGAMSVFDVDSEDWLVEKWKEAARMLPGVCLSWEDAVAHLESVVWMRYIHNDMGRELYTKLMNIGE